MLDPNVASLLYGFSQNMPFVRKYFFLSFPFLCFPFSSRSRDMAEQQEEDP